MNYIYTKCSQVEIKNWRSIYIENLSFPIELHVEWLAKEGIPFLIWHNNNIIGYFILILEKEEINCLLEFYLISDYISKCQIIFQDILSKNKIESIMVQSFDSMTLKCCLTSKLSHEIVGILFREYLDTKQENISLFSKKLAIIQDFDMLLSYKDGLYESEDELKFMLNNQMIYLYYLNNVIVGCGYLIQVRSNKDWYDIGMWVYTPYRNQGIATKIISDLKYHCLINDYTIICGCAAENIASRKTLERNGFISKHNLLLFKI